MITSHRRTVESVEPVDEIPSVDLTPEAVNWRKRQCNRPPQRKHSLATHNNELSDIKDIRYYFK